MEKIYMEEHNNKKQNLFQKISNSKIAMASVTLVFVAVLSLVVIGLDQTSFAEEVNPTKVFPSNTMKIRTQEAGDTIIPLVNGTPVTNSPLRVYPYSAVITNPASGTDPYHIFCLEHDRGYAANVELSRTTEITGPEGYGLLYLMANIYPNKNFDGLTESDEELQTWLSQIAVWLYLGQVNEADVMKVNGIADSEGEPIKQNVNLYENYIKPVVTAAKKVSSDVTAKGIDKVKFGINFDNTVNISEDQKYYQTSLISVTANNPFDSYSLKLTTAPKGAYVVDENGNKIENLNNIQPNVKFYIRIPVSSVTDKANAVKFTAVANGVKTYSGYKFEGTYKDTTGTTDIKAQTVTNVFITTSNVEDTNEFVLKVPDTGMSTAQTVYFIGLIVLLSGVGIIYANAKPKATN